MKKNESSENDELMETQLSETNMQINVLKHSESDDQKNVENKESETKRIEQEELERSRQLEEKK